MDFKEVFNKQIPPLLAEVQANNQTKLSTSLIYMVPLTVINSFVILCIFPGPFTAQGVITFRELCPFQY